MSFSDIFIRRPVLATVVALMIILLGLQGIAQLSVREYPKVDETVITVTTAYAGASAELIQGFITSPIAESVATTENIDYVTSSSRPSSSTVTVQMKLGANPDAALTEVIAKVNQVRGNLPSESDDPVIVKGTGQSFATMYLAAQNPNMTSEQITEYLERVMQPRISTVQGVAKAEILGGQVYSMRVWLDPIQLAARQITAPEVLAAINASNFLSAPGTTKTSLLPLRLHLNRPCRHRKLSVRCRSRLPAMKSFVCAMLQRWNWRRKARTRSFRSMVLRVHSLQSTQRLQRTLSMLRQRSGKSFRPFRHPYLKA